MDRAYLQFTGYVDNPMRSVLLTPEALNVNNLVQAEGAARGRKNRLQHWNSVGVQHSFLSWLSAYGALIFGEDAFPRATAIALHEVIHIAHLRCGVKEFTHRRSLKGEALIINRVGHRPTNMVIN